LEAQWGFQVSLGLAQNKKPTLTQGLAGWLRNKKKNKNKNKNKN
jgi:hypothetical protein